MLGFTVLVFRCNIKLKYPPGMQDCCTLSNFSSSPLPYSWGFISFSSLLANSFQFFRLPSLRDLSLPLCCTLYTCSANPIVAFPGSHCEQIDNTTTSRRPLNVNPGCLPRCYIHQKFLYPILSSLLPSLPSKIPDRERE